jgi:hypothetical protein
MGREVYFVGTIPFDRTIEVFTVLGERIGSRATRIPDGEIGDRKLWVSSQYSVLAACPALETCPFPAGGLTRQTSYELPLRLRPDAQDAEIIFGDLGYARHALASFGLFEAMQDAGKLPESWKFQVNLPSPTDVMSMIEPASRARVEPLYERAMLKQLDQIQNAIPHDKLCITWDVVRGVLFWEAPENKYFPCWFADPLAGTVERLAKLGDAVNASVQLGYHLCYGSQDHKHALEPHDLNACVKLMNAVVKALDRPVDYVHMPVPRDRDDAAYFAPLVDLDPSIKQVYLGLIHYSDGVAGARRRISVAETFRNDFGVATECGFGRRPHHQDILRLIDLHAEVGDL